VHINGTVHICHDNYDKDFFTCCIHTTIHGTNLINFTVCSNDTTLQALSFIGENIPSSLLS
jgi:hypothetical protein